MKISKKRKKSGNAHIGTLIVFSVTIVISVSLVGLVSYFYMKHRNATIAKTILTDTNSTIGDIQKIKGLESCNATGVKYDAISNKYSLEGVTDHTTGVCNLTSISGVSPSIESYNFSDKLASSGSNGLTSSESCVYDECLSNGFYVINSTNATYAYGCNTSGLPDASNKCILKIISSGIYVSPGSSESIGYHRNIITALPGTCKTNTSTCSDIKVLSGLTPSRNSDKFAVLYCNNLNIPKPGNASQWYISYELGMRDMATNKEKLINIPNSINNLSNKTYWTSWNGQYGGNLFNNIILWKSYSGVYGTGNNYYNTSLYIRCIAK